MKRFVLAVFAAILLSACGADPVVEPELCHENGDTGAALQCKDGNGSVIIDLPPVTIPIPNPPTKPEKPDWQVCLDNDGNWVNKQCEYPSQ